MGFKNLYRSSISFSSVVFPQMSVCDLTIAIPTWAEYLFVPNPPRILWLALPTGIGGWMDTGAVAGSCFSAPENQPFRWNRPFSPPARIFWPRTILRFSADSTIMPWWSNRKADRKVDSTMAPLGQECVHHRRYRGWVIKAIVRSSLSFDGSC
jgi:hypothetical protein